MIGQLFKNMRLSTKKNSSFIPVSLGGKLSQILQGGKGLGLGFLSVYQSYRYTLTVKNLPNAIKISPEYRYTGKKPVNHLYRN